jgi:hypothetical protein
MLSNAAGVFVPINAKDVVPPSAQAEKRDWSRFKDFTSSS